MIFKFQIYLGSYRGWERLIIELSQPYRLKLDMASLLDGFSLSNYLIHQVQLPGIIILQIFVKG